jgi:hypothetical protein
MDMWGPRGAIRADQRHFAGLSFCGVRNRFFDPSVYRRVGQGLAAAAYGRHMNGVQSRQQVRE